MCLESNSAWRGDCHGQSVQISTCGEKSQSKTGTRPRRDGRSVARVVFALMLVGGTSQGQTATAAKTASTGISSGSAQIALMAYLPTTLRLSISSINLDVAVLNPAQPSALVSVPVNSSWNLNSSSSSVQLVGYFDSQESALSDGAGHAVPSNHVLGGLAGSPSSPFNETTSVGTPGASRVFFQQPIGKGNVSGSRIDVLQIGIGAIADLGAPEGNYHGILHLRLVAF